MGRMFYELFERTLNHGSSPEYMQYPSDTLRESNAQAPNYLYSRVIPVHALLPPMTLVDTFHGTLERELQKMILQRKLRPCCRLGGRGRFSTRFMG